MSRQRYTLNEPAVLNFIVGLHLSGINFFKITADGSHKIFPARNGLAKLLGASEETASRLLHEAVAVGLITKLDFVWNGRKTKPSQRQPKPTKAVKPPKVTEPKKKPGPKKQEPAEPVNDDGEEHPLRLKGFSQQRYTLIETSSGWLGVWDKWNCEQTLISRDLTDVLDEIDRLNLPKKPYYPKPGVHSEGMNSSHKRKSRSFHPGSTNVNNRFTRKNPRSRLSGSLINYATN